MTGCFVPAAEVPVVVGVGGAEVVGFAVGLAADEDVPVGCAELGLAAVDGDVDAAVVGYEEAGRTVDRSAVEEDVPARRVDRAELGCAELTCVGCADA